MSDYYTGSVDFTITPSGIVEHDPILEGILERAGTQSLLDNLHSEGGMLCIPSLGKLA